MHLGKCKFLLLGLIATLTISVRAQITNSVTPNGFTAYVISGTNNPTLTLYRGVTYVFNLNVSGHPFFIKTNVSGGTTDQYTNGVINNGAVSGSLIFVPPANSPNQLSYNCANHSTTFGMHGFMNLANPPAPPSGQIVLVSISPDLITMQSLGASDWKAIPEFTSNLTSGAWSAVPGFTNIFANGTNTSTFNRLDPVCGDNVFLRVRNQFP